MHGWGSNGAGLAREEGELGVDCWMQITESSLAMSKL